MAVYINALRKKINEKGIETVLRFINILEEGRV
jgi:hypothetical protein